MFFVLCYVMFSCIVLYITFIKLPTSSQLIIKITLFPNWLVSIFFRLPIPSFKSFFFNIENRVWSIMVEISLLDKLLVIWFISVSLFLVALVPCCCIEKMWSVFDRFLVFKQVDVEISSFIASHIVGNERSTLRFHLYK